MKTGLQLNVSQHLTLTPQLQQAIRLLQLSTMDLNQEIQQALESNPMLELSEPDNNITVTKKDDLNNSMREASIDTSDTQHYSSSPAVSKASDNYNYEHFYGTTTNLYDHMNWQLSLCPVSDIDNMIAITLIDAIDEDGFLTQTVEEIQQSLYSEDTPIELDEIEAVRQRLMRFDPVGCVCNNLSESLLIQLERLDVAPKLLTKAKNIIRHDLKLLGQHNYRQLQKKHHINEDMLADVIELIQAMHPKPGNQIETTKTEYVTPDVSVKKVNGHWQVLLNGDVLPKLSINGSYASLIRRADNSRDNVFLKNNLQEARWFLKSIQSRQETLLKVTLAIVDHQQDFLEHGEESMKPLILNDIAEKLEMHESTISRVTTNKYIHTPRGVYELKYFFSSHLSTSAGGECSSTAIRAVIKKLIAAENPKKPLSDEKMAKLLAEQGIKVARRTIAKYREAMGIAPSNERKTIIR